MERDVERSVGDAMKPAADRVTYVYALVRVERAPTVPRGVRGLPGTSAVRAVAVGDRLWLLVADAPRARYGAATIERNLSDLDWVSTCAIGHEAVIERVTGVDALAPMKLFTIFDDDERAVTTIRRDQRRLERALDRVAGRQEWSVRVLLDERRALARMQERSTRAATRGASGKGATFLARKKAERDASRRLVADARRSMEPVFAELERHAGDARQRVPSAAEAGTRLLLDAAFLVRTRDAARFKSAVKRVSTRLARDGYDVTLSGPWPPYSFVAEPA
jgi:gas vesicle protein GvpL/GvpF